MNLFKPETKFDIKLQSPSKSFWSTFRKAYISKRDFKNFWLKLDKKNLPKSLVINTNNFVNSPSYKFVSKFWRHCLIQNFKKFSLSKSKNLDRKIRISDYTSNTFFNDNNFNELYLSNNALKKIDFNLFKKHKNLNFYNSISYNVVTAIYFTQIKETVKKYYKKINKNFYNVFGHNIKINNFILNQQLLYSLIEIKKIDTLLRNKKKNLKILEFGAGYGRTANTLLSLKKNTKYVIVDIPPSFFVSSRQFKKHYPNLKINYAFDINNKVDLSNTIDANDIIYIYPHQLTLLKKNYFDLTIMAGVTLEMEPKDIQHYMRHVNVLSKNLYMKVFKYSGLPFSFYKVYRYNVKDDYFIPNNWKRVFLDIGIETDYFCHFGYKIK